MAGHSAVGRIRCCLHSADGVMDERPWVLRQATEIGFCVRRDRARWAPGSDAQIAALHCSASVESAKLMADGACVLANWRLHDLN